MVYEFNGRMPLGLAVFKSGRTDPTTNNIKQREPCETEQDTLSLDRKYKSLYVWTGSAA
jgi:hypothetical protein